MATAVEPSSTPQPRTPSAGAGLAFASVVGAVYVLAALAVVFYFIPKVWEQNVQTVIGNDALRNALLRWPLTLVVVGVLAKFGWSLAGANPPKGLRAGVFLVLVAALAGFLLGGAATGRFEGTAGQVVTAAVVGAVVFGVYRLFSSPRGERLMVTLEEQGWFHGNAYKRVLGRVVRRVSLIGIMLVGLTGVYSLSYQGSIPETWDVTLPFVHTAEGAAKSFTLVPDAKNTIPILLVLLTGWVAYRAVNMPQFAEFLIATEAEMNKVSWSSKKRLAQDTVVVLVTTVAMALFLLFVDVFWGWLLSREWVGVLPSRSQTDDAKAGQVQAARW